MGDRRRNSKLRLGASPARPLDHPTTVPTAATVVPTADTVVPTADTIVPTADTVVFAADTAASTADSVVPTASSRNYYRHSSAYCRCIF